ncbi:MAG: alpha/beta fold hydrolase [Cyanobacteria bacterium]|nr:alpha/beta fold hydrolase [Cyanobacteriota bacterium]
MRHAPRAEVTLICFAYAGGNAMVFNTWPRQLPLTANVLAVQLPGHGARFRERPFDSVADVVPYVTSLIEPTIVGRVVFFGHSLGGLLAFETARRLRRLTGCGPTRLIVSGKRPPQIPDDDDSTRTMAQQEFIDHLRELNGTPPEVLGNPELLEILMPALRADFAMGETYRYVDEPPLACAITAIGGTDDPDVSAEQLDGWRDHTIGDFERRLLPGNHFFLHTAEDRLLEIIRAELRLSISGRPASRMSDCT